MRVHTVRIRNFRCYEDDDNSPWSVVFHPLPGLNLLVGGNGSGKTTVCDAIDLTLNPDGRANRSLVTEWDFPRCDTTKTICIETVLTGFSQVPLGFEADVQWVNKKDGVDIAGADDAPDEKVHIRAITVRFEAWLDPEDGTLRWRWLLPKFAEVGSQPAKELGRQQHETLGYFRIKPSVTSGTFALGQYSALGRHLRRLRYRLGKLPGLLKSGYELSACTLSNVDCADCRHKDNCSPQVDAAESVDDGNTLTVGQHVAAIVEESKRLLGEGQWSEMDACFGPRYGGMDSQLAAVTLGLRTGSPKNPKFIPFERLSDGEKYALAFVLAKAQVPGDTPPVLLMEEPETALHPPGIAALLASVQSVANGGEPQLLVTTHSESVLRNVSLEHIFVMDKKRNPKRLHDVLSKSKPKKGSLSKPDYLIMPGGGSVLFAGKVIVMEGAHEMVTCGRLMRLASTLASKDATSAPSLPLQGWSLFSAANASAIPDTVKILQALGKDVVVVVDGDGAGLSAARETQDSVPTFVLGSVGETDATLEDALLAGLKQKHQDKVKTGLCTGQESQECGMTQPCWKTKGMCNAVGDKQDRKERLQELCIEHYRMTDGFPPAFRMLLQQVGSAQPGTAHRLPLTEDCPF